MLRRHQPGCVNAVVSSTVGSSVRHYFNAAPDPIGKAHPDLQNGYMPTNYRGRGWASFQKQLPAEMMVTQGGDTMTNMNDRQGFMQDPEDPRHPMVRAQLGPEAMKGMDNSVHPLINADFGPIPKSSRLLQLLYNNYLEPLNMSRIAVPLQFLHKIPCNGENILHCTTEYLGQTISLIGNVYLGAGSVVMEGVTMRADTNQIVIHEGCQIHENVCVIADAPTTLHHYQRQETFNPYQCLDASEGTVRILMNTIVEPNCMIESCNIGSFCRIGHGTKIMKGVNMGAFVHILPGSVVLADTHCCEGEVWGGAPAVKLGKVSKFEYKKPWVASVHHREQVVEVKASHSWMGDQMAIWSEEMDKLDNLMLQFEDGLSDGVKAQMREFIEGREPFAHTIARITQGWSPANRADDKMYDHRVPTPVFNPHKEHNDDSESEYTGTIFNFRKYITGEKRG